MIIELFGSTSSGKSTLLEGIIKASHEQGIKAYNAEAYVLGKVRLNWLRGYLPRTLAIDLIALLNSLFAWRRNFDFFYLMATVLLSLPSKTGLFTKLNIARNVLKKIGIYEYIRRNSNDQEIVLMDEGTINTANYLFVHPGVERSDLHFSTFVRTVPLPDVAIYLREDEEILVERTLERGHKRIQNGSAKRVEKFIKLSMDTFETLIQNIRIASRLVIINNHHQIIFSRKCKNLSLEALILKVLQGGLLVVDSGYPRKIEVVPTLQFASFEGAERIAYDLRID